MAASANSSSHHQPNHRPARGDFGAPSGPSEAEAGTGARPRRLRAAALLPTLSRIAEAWCWGCGAVAIAAAEASAFPAAEGGRSAVCVGSGSAPAFTIGPVIHPPTTTNTTSDGRAQRHPRNSLPLLVSSMGPPHAGREQCPSPKFLRIRVRKRQIRNAVKEYSLVVSNRAVADPYPESHKADDPQP